MSTFGEELREAIIGQVTYHRWWHRTATLLPSQRTQGKLILQVEGTNLGVWVGEEQWDTEKPITMFLPLWNGAATRSLDAAIAAGNWSYKDLQSQVEYPQSSRPGKPVPDEYLALRAQVEAEITAQLTQEGYGHALTS